MGVTPDVEVAMSEEDYFDLYYDRLDKADDGQLQAAIELLK